MRILASFLVAVLFLVLAASLGNAAEKTKSFRGKATVAISPPMPGQPRQTTIDMRMKLTWMSGGKVRVDSTQQGHIPGKPGKSQTMTTIGTIRTDAPGELVLHFGDEGYRAAIEGSLNEVAEDVSPLARGMHIPVKAASSLATFTFGGGGAQMSTTADVTFGKVGGLRGIAVNKLLRPTSTTITAELAAD